jgi:hypothetical protein
LHVMYDHVVDMILIPQAWPTPEHAGGLVSDA